MTSDSYIGVDVGGTFTDIIYADAEGFRVLKLPTTPDPSSAVKAGIEKLGRSAHSASRISHATTLATNALLTRSGLAKTALVTNKGFRDVLEIGRQRRPDVYGLSTRRPPPLVRRRDRLEVSCRVDASGKELEPLRKHELEELSRTVKAEGYESVAVCFLNSYLNGSHERAVGDCLKQAGFKGHISLSSEVDREYREYERTSTTVVNAVLSPLVAGYLSLLHDSLARSGVTAPVYVMNSDGGSSTLRFASSRPVAVIESGPAAGVIASSELSRKLSLGDVLTFDMGGTTAKAGAVVKGSPDIVGEFEAAGRSHSGRSIKGSGYPVRGPFIDLAEISAGGGTIARLDEAGDLIVGPESAGSEPGPACYGRGGKEPTVTDADVFLGRLSPVSLLGGEMPIRRNLSARALSRLSGSFGPDEAAEGILRIVNDHMARAMSIVSVERGRDPRDFTLLAFGGAGPGHACDVAEEIGITRMFVPAHAGLFSAYGLLAGGLSRTFLSPMMGGVRDLPGRFRELEASAAEQMRSEGFPEFGTERFAEVRYEGQSHELTVPYMGPTKLRDSFDRQHKMHFGYSSADKIQVVNIRVRARVSRWVPPPLMPEASPRPSHAGERKAWFRGGYSLSPVYQRGSLGNGTRGSGPCIIEEYDSTLVVNPGWRWVCEEYGTRLVR